MPASYTIAAWRFEQIAPLIDGAAYLQDLERQITAQNITQPANPDPLREPNLSS